MDCGYVKKACVCRPVSNKLPEDWEDYKATYDDSSHNDYIDTAMMNRDAEIKYKTDETDEEEEIPF